MSERTPTVTLIVNRVCPECRSDEIGAVINLRRIYPQVTVGDLGEVGYSGWGSQDEDELVTLFCHACQHEFQPIVTPTPARREA
jgi:hypothetical protein